MDTGQKSEAIANQVGVRKDWDQLTSDEKIERMRDIIKVQSSYIGNLQVSVHNMRRKLSKHQHIDNKVVEMKEITDYDNEANSLTGTGTVSSSKFF